jgi:hypothetical protein
MWVSFVSRIQTSTAKRPENNTAGEQNYEYPSLLTLANNPELITFATQLVDEHMDL